MPRRIPGIRCDHALMAHAMAGKDPPVGMPKEKGTPGNGARRLCEFPKCERERTCLYYCNRHHRLVCQGDNSVLHEEDS